MPSKSWKELFEEAEAEAGGFSPVPAGDYDFVISSAEATKTANGKDMFKVQAKIVDGPSKNRVVFNNFVISPESPVALRIFFQQMKVLGLTGENLFHNDPTPEQIAAAMFGKIFRGSVIVTEYNSQERNEIKNFSSIPESDRARVQTAASALLSGSGTGAPVGNATPGGSPTPPAPAATPTAPAPAPAPAVEAPAPAPAPASSGSIPPPPPVPSF